MVVSYKTETHYEFYDQRNGWVPQIYRATGESTWERKGSEWKLVRETVFRADTQLDPKWVEEHEVWNKTATEIIRRAGQVGGCHYPDCK